MLSNSISNIQNSSYPFQLKTEHGLFRFPEENPVDSSLAFILPDLDLDSDELPGPLFPSDIIEPLLPPQINYDKVSQVANKKKKNETLILRKFYFNPTFNNIMLLIIFVLFTMWVILSNSVTILALWRTRARGHIAEIYLANLAVSDVLLGILILPLMCVVILIGYFPFGPIVCDAWVFLDYYLIVASSFGNTALMCNYFWMIRFPKTFPADLRHHIVTLIVLWLAVNLSWTPPFFNDRLSVIYPTGQCGFSISRNQYFSFYIGVTGLYLPLLISLVCGIWSAATLRQKYGVSLFFWRSQRMYSSDPLISRKTDWKYSKRHVHSIMILDDHNKQRKKYKTTDDQLPTSAVGRLSEIMKNSFSNSVNEADEISRIAEKHFPTVASYLVLSILCRGMFFIYFGVGSFVHQFFPPDLSNGVYWLMHSEAALSPIVHFCFDSELRHGILRILGLRNPRNSPLVQPTVSITNLKKDSGTTTTDISSPPIITPSSSKNKIILPPLPAISGCREKPRSLQHFMSFDHDKDHRNRSSPVGTNRSPEGGLHL